MPHLIIMALWYVLLSGKANHWPDYFIHEYSGLSSSIWKWGNQLIKFSCKTLRACLQLHEHYRLIWIVDFFLLSRSMASLHLFLSSSVFFNIFSLKRYFAFCFLQGCPSVSLSHMYRLWQHSQYIYVFTCIWERDLDSWPLSV